MNTTIFVAEELGHPLRNILPVLLYLFIIVILFILFSLILRFLLAPLLRKLTTKLENKFDPPVQPDLNKSMQGQPPYQNQPYQPYEQPYQPYYQPVQDNSQDIRCTNCGALNPPNAQHCIQCGERLY